MLLAEAQAAKALPAGDAIEEAVDALAFKGESWPARVRRDGAGRRRSHRYSRDLAAAWRALTNWWLGRTIDGVELWSEWDPHRRTRIWHCDCTAYVLTRNGSGDWNRGAVAWESFGEGETPALAICRTMLDIEAAGLAETPAETAPPVLNGRAR